MKRKIILAALLSLLLAGCGSDYPSSPEAVLKKGVEALHSKNRNDVNRYFDLDDWLEVKRYKIAITDESAYRFLPERIVKVVNTEEGDGRVVITAKVVRKDGEEEEQTFALRVTPSGRWKIVLPL